MPEDTVIRMDDNVKNDNSPDSEEPPRHKAGFDFAAGPYEALFFAPQIYISFGIIGFICLFTIIVIACGGIYYSSGCFLFAILFASIIFVPQPMGHWIHWIVQCIFWICISLALQMFNQHVVKHSSHLNNVPKSYIISKFPHEMRPTQYDGNHSLELSM